MCESTLEITWTILVGASLLPKSIRISLCKNSYLFQQKCYFFHFIQQLFTYPHTRLSILHSISLKYQFLFIFFSLHTITTIHSILLSSVYIKKEYKIRCKISSVNVNLHDHYINFVNLHFFNLTNMNNFKTYKYIKLIIFFF